MKETGISRKLIEKFAKYYNDDSVVLFPTDTVVGLGCKFDSTGGIERIRNIKGTAAKTPLAVLIANDKQTDFLKIRRSRIANLLMEKFWPGGLTIVLSAEQAYPCSGDGNSIGLRMPDSELLRKIIEQAGVPLAATSANLHGQPPPAQMANVQEDLRKMVDHVIEFEIRPSGSASTVVRIEGGHVKIIRVGSITEREIFDAMGGRG